MASTLNPKAGMVCGARGRVSTVSTVGGDCYSTVGTLRPLWANYKPSAHAAFDKLPARAPEVRDQVLPPGRLLSVAQDLSLLWC